jgi:hypothetical protein
MKHQLWLPLNDGNEINYEGKIRRIKDKVLLNTRGSPFYKKKKIRNLVSKLFYPDSKQQIQIRRNNIQSLYEKGLSPLQISRRLSTNLYEIENNLYRS